MARRSFGGMASLCSGHGRPRLLEGSEGVPVLLPLQEKSYPLLCSSEKKVAEKKRMQTKQRRVVVTGMGVVTPLGHDPDNFYEKLLEGVSGISEIETFDCSSYPTRIAGEIKSFSSDGWVAPKLSKRMDKFMLYLLTAGKKALENGGLTEEVMSWLDKARCGILIGSAMGGMKVSNDAIAIINGVQIPPGHQQILGPGFHKWGS